MSTPDRYTEITQLVGELRHALDAAGRPDLDALIRPILDELDTITGQHTTGDANLERALTNMRFARIVLTAGGLP